MKYPTIPSKVVLLLSLTAEILCPNNLLNNELFPELGGPTILISDDLASFGDLKSDF